MLALSQRIRQVLLRCGQLAIYQVVLTNKVDWPQSASRNSLGVRFIKVMSRTFEARQGESLEKTSSLAEQRRALRTLIPFTTTPPTQSPSSPVNPMSGVFVTGDEPTWIIATDKEGLQSHPCGWQSVNSLTTCSLWDSRSDFLMHTDEVKPFILCVAIAFSFEYSQGPCLVEWMLDVNLGSPMPSRSRLFGRTYSKVTYNATAGLLVASSVMENKLSIFDEEDNEMWSPDGKS